MKTIKTYLTISASLIFSYSTAQQYNFGATKEDSIACTKNYSLYNEYYKQKDYSAALEPLQNTIKHCPKLHKSIYVNGEKVYKALIKKEADAGKKAALSEMLISLYDHRMEHFGQKGYVMGKKGAMLYKQDRKNPEQAHKILEESFKLQGDKADPNSLLYLFKSKYALYKKGSLTKQQVIDTYPTIAAVIEKNISKAKKTSTKEAYQSVGAEIDKTFSKVATCEEIVAIYNEKFNANADDQALLKTITNVLDKAKCTDSDLFFKAASKLHAKNPSAESAYALGVNQKENCAKAAPFFKQAAELSSDADFKQKAYMNAAKCYLASRSYANARKFAREVLNLNANSGDAYILIGNAYAAGSSQCGDNACEKKAGYWAAVDKFNKAKAVDASVADKAQKLINKYSGYFPGKEDCFFYNITQGASYTVKGWISETTSARFYK